ncbi:neuronal acetylcholine receptor subunit beta-3 [Anopheles cruzii]|uniref:neuronal acetylcholine receptor subunit beta-3 n=1 Tax=Anopheles cruzii TaxID=68878 RepID=UPI0022EC4778|nr:neuronal acetylcholine receptor subunit beta-3 [Anopheles cruzii]
MTVASAIRTGTLILLIATLCHADTKYNVTFDELHKCKQYNAISGYNYRTFFRLHELDHHRTLQDTVFYVDLLVYVMAPRDGHILFSQETKTTNNSLEIVLGGGSNTFSTIRLGSKGAAVKSKPRSGLLSPIEPLPVRIRISETGEIKVFAGNLTGEPFMETLVPAMASGNRVQYVSFSSWGTALAKWFYDCPLPGPANSTAIDGSELEYVPTASERLHRALREHPRWTDPPEQFSGVNISTLYVEEFVYDQMTDVMELSGMVRFSWRDPRYSWNSTDYENKLIIAEVCDVLWMPSFEGSLFSGHFSTCYVRFDGTVVAEIDEFIWYNYCSLSNNYRWPYDSNACHVRLFAVTYNRTVPIRLTNSAMGFEIEFEQSEWSLTQIVKHEYEQTDTPYGLVPALELHIEMSRKSDIHSVAIYPSYFVSNLLISVSFLMDGRTRVLLNTLGLVVLVKSFLSLSVIVPRCGVPKIYTFFRWSLVFYSISLILYVVDLWLKRTRATIAPQSWLNRAINFPALRYILAMDQRSNYSTLEHKNVLWDEVTYVLNRIMMLVVMVVFCVGYVKP